jgi:hypothetical protein
VSLRVEPHLSILLGLLSGQALSQVSPTPFELLRLVFVPHLLSDPLQYLSRVL